ncbi:hypothetical protein KSP39_PZI021895 [Platanthera zijinensis]|uniref:FMP27/BLTP2/Hobbit GFWDK motif-containing RBG unit domain-containing protein n=1 Tax=Platanthera zijinensis TaxID=2320716 RepID=A0AAP0AYW0_9ASPA
MGLIKLVSFLLVFCCIGWVVSRFAARLLAWFLSRVMTASVEFEVAGCNSLRDITLKFSKGTIDYISIGEIKLTLGRSLPKMGCRSMYSHLRLQLLICDLEVVIKKPELSNKKGKSQGSNSSKKGKLLLTIANITRFLSVSIKEIVIKVPKAIIGVKELRLDIQKESGYDPLFKFFLHLTPLLIQMYTPESSFDQPFDNQQTDRFIARKECSSILERNPAPIICEDISVSCEFVHERKRLCIRALDLSTGVITADLNEGLFLKSNTKPESSDGTYVNEEPTQEESVTRISKQKFQLESIKKCFFVLPEKVCITVPKVDVKFTHRGQDLSFRNSILGVNLSSNISKTTEENTAHGIFRLDFTEIHLLKGTDVSIVEIAKLSFNASVDAPIQENVLIKVGANLKIGATQCNLILDRLSPWLKLSSSGNKRVVIRDESPSAERSLASERNGILWTCAVSAPEFSILTYSLNKLPLYRGYCQSCNFSASNVATKGIQVHIELSELLLLMENGLQAQVKQKLLGEENSSGSLMNIIRLTIDWGPKEMQTHERDNFRNWKRVLSVDVTGMGVFLSFQQIESLISTMMAYKTLLKRSLPSNKKVTQDKMRRSSKTTLGGTQIMKVNIDSCMIKLCGDMTVEDTVVIDPKRVNFGSHGGQVVISESSDGTPRTATVLSNLPSGSNHVKFKTSVEVVRLSLYINKEKESTQIGFERVRSIYEEVTGDKKQGDKITIFDIQKTKFLRRASGTTDAVRSLFSAVDIAVRWEPDIHLSLFEFATRLKFLVQNIKLKDSSIDINGPSLSVEGMIPDNVVMHPGKSEKQNRKRDSVFALDVENLRISAELADGVEAMIHASSIFSENAKIGVLLEGFVLSLNEARILKSGRLQLSSVPISLSSSINATVQPPTTRDWIIQCLDVHACLPYRLQLRAIDDAIEETFRGLKLVSSALSTVTFPVIKGSSTNKKSGISKVGSLRVILRRFSVDIEEEPMQGWLDEHYYLMKNHVCELNARLKFLDELISGESSCKCTEPSNQCSERKIYCQGDETNIPNNNSVHLLREEIYRQAFQSYYQACQNIALSDGSGACSKGFQSGFKPSKVRGLLLSLSATDLDVNLSKFEGGLHGMIDFINKVDPYCLENNIPFSRIYGTNLLLNAGSLIVQLRNYTFPIFAGNSCKCQGRIVLAQQATCFQPQVLEDVFVGKWRRVRMLRSVSGTTPAMKTYLDLPISFHKGEVSYGVGYEPVFADLSYVFTVALRRAKLGLRRSNPNLNVLEAIPPPKKERSLPWWDDMRYYIHGKIGLFFINFEANVLATSDPYEKQDKVQFISQEMDIQQTDGQVNVSSKDFRFYISSIHGLLKKSRLKVPCHTSIPVLKSPNFSIHVTMDWEVESGNPLNHYLHALPNESVPREKIFDPFRSLSLSLRWSFSLGVSEPPYDKRAPSEFGNGPREMVGNGFSEKMENISVGYPTFNLGVHDLVWLIKWWNMVYLPPHKLRSFSRWPRFGVPRVPRSGNLSLDKVMTEFFLRIESTPACIKHSPLRDDDPSKGLTFRSAKLKYELCWGRGKQKYTFDCKRDILDVVYHGIDLHMLKVYLDRDMLQGIQTKNSISESALAATSDGVKRNVIGGFEKNDDTGFLLYSDYFSARRQTPKADSSRLSGWQQAGRRNTGLSHFKDKEGNDSDSEDEHSDPSDDEGYNVVIADSCQRIFVYGLKLLWTLENRDVVWSWANGLSKIFEPQKPSPSRQYAQKKMLERQKELHESQVLKVDSSISSSSTPSGCASLPPQDTENPGRFQFGSPTTEEVGASANLLVKHEQSNDTEDEGKGHFMINVVQPQFNLHAEDANGRFLLAAASGRVLARSFHSLVHVGLEVIEKAMGTDTPKIPEAAPELTWKRVELSVMLEHVQAHVAPTDVDPGAGIQWLPKIHRISRKVKRTGALLERVFMPCQMYFRYTRHRSIATDFKVKPLKELSFNSPDIMASMTSRQFQVMLDVLTNLLFARLPKMEKNCLSYPSEDDDDIEEEADVVIPYGIEEVELSRINLEQVERERSLLLDDIRILSINTDVSFDPPVSQGICDNLYKVLGEKPILVHELKMEFESKQRIRKAALSELRAALQKAAQLRLFEKEKSKSPSYAIRISMRISKVVWSMIEEGKPFAEVEINNLAYYFDRDFKDIGIAQFTIKSFVVRNGLPNSKSGMLLSAWNAPIEWGKNFMLRVDAKQGAPREGRSPIELFQVNIFPLKIHLTESMYRMMWHYFFPGDEQDQQRRQEAWKVSTTSGSKRGKKGSFTSEATASSSQSSKEFEACERQNLTKPVKSENLKGNIPHGPELRRTSSFDKTWEESVAESVANELVMNAHSSSHSPTKSGPLVSSMEHPVNEMSKSKPKDVKSVKPYRQSLEEKKDGKSPDNKRARPARLTEFHNVKISQVELLLTYDGSRFPVSDLRLLMDTFHREEFICTWGRLFSRVKKHVIWGVLKSVTGMQGKKFKAKSLGQKDVQENGSPTSDLNLSGIEGVKPRESYQFPVQFLKHQDDGAGDGFVTSIRGLFSSQRRKAKAFVLRTMRGDADGDLLGDWSDGDTEISPFARQLTITKARRLIQRHTKKFRMKGKNSSVLELPGQDSPPSSSEKNLPFEIDSSDASSDELNDDILPN